MELDVIPVTLFSKLQGLLNNWEMADLSREIQEIRSIKSDFEVRQIKRSGRSSTASFPR